MCLKTRVPFMHIGDGSSPDLQLLCTFCNQTNPATEMTAGRLYSNGTQAFVCKNHSWNKSQWLSQWAVFAARQLKLPAQPVSNNEFYNILEIRPLPRLTDLANDVAYHLQTRKDTGPVLIITQRPAVFLSILRRRWMKMLRILQRERASTLDTNLIQQFMSDIDHIQNARFACNAPSDAKKADIYVVAPEQAQTLPLDCGTIYSCAPNLMPNEAILDNLEKAIVLVVYK